MCPPVGLLLYLGARTIIAIVIALAVLAAYGQTSTGTGFENNVTLWDWMTMLVQPVAIANGPLTPT